MRILRVIASAKLTDGGPIEGVRRVGAALAALGHTQDVATMTPPDECEASIDAMRVYPLGEPRGSKLLGHFGYTSRAVPWLRAHAPDYDVVIVSGLWNYATMAARRALVGGPTPYVVFTHGMLDPWFRETYPFKAAIKQLLWLVNEGVLLRHAHAVLFTSEEERLRARGAFFPYSVRERVIAYGTADVTGDADAQKAAFRGAVPALRDRSYLLYLSRIHRKKGCDLLVEGFADYARRVPDTDLVIAGPDETGWKGELQARAVQLGIADRIHWPGMVRGDAKAGGFRGCEAIILPSHQENFGIVVAEAISFGKPVLISNKVNIWREIEGDGAGLVADDTLQGVRSLLDRFATMDAAARAEMGRRARACYLERFDIRMAARTLVDALDDAIASRAAATSQP